MDEGRTTGPRAAAVATKEGTAARVGAMAAVATVVATAAVMVAVVTAAATVVETAEEAVVAARAVVKVGAATAEARAALEATVVAPGAVAAGRVETEGTHPRTRCAHYRCCSIPSPRHGSRMRGAAPSSLPHRQSSTIYLSDHGRSTRMPSP